MDFGFYRELSARHGAARLLAHGAYRALGRLTGLSVWNMMAAELDELERLDIGRGADAPELETGALAPHTRNPDSTGLAEDAYRAATARGDRCFGFVEKDRLAHFSWFSTRPTVMFDMGKRYVLHFDSRAWVYVHNCYTNPADRGRQLHGRALVSAARALRREGYRGMLARVAWNNFASLKSFERLGFRTVAYALLVPGSERPMLTRGRERFGLRFEPPKLRVAGENSVGK